jgi:hypothetical protein
VTTRRRLVLAGAAAAVTLARPAGAAEPSDPDRLARLLALERRLESTYATALERGAVERELGELLLGHEREHVRALEQALRRRASPDAAPAPASAAPRDRRAFARFAHALERETVIAYGEVLAALHSERLLQPLGSIMAAGAQHQVALRQVAGQDLLRVP